MPRDDTPLAGYMASALTGLEGDARQSVYLTCDMIATICKAHGIELYEPRKKTDPVHNADIEDHRVYFTDRDRVSNSDVVFLFCDHPSFGAGQELEIASAATVPIVLIVTTRGGRVSRMVTGATGLQHRIKKEEPEDVRLALNELLTELVPQLRSRRERLANVILPEVSTRIVAARRLLGMDRDVLADKVGMREEWVRQLESESIATVNPSLRQLARVAAALDVSLPDLLDVQSKDHALRIPIELADAAVERRVSAKTMLLALRTAARDGDPHNWDKNLWVAVLAEIEAGA